MSRRTTLRAAGGGAATLAALLGIGTLSGAASQTGAGVEGAWRVVPTPAGGQPAPPNFNFFTPDGAVVNVAADQTRGIGIGRWLMTGDREYSNTFWFHRFTDTGAFAGNTKILARIQLNETGDSFRGVFKATQFDVSGNVLTTREGIQDATRIEVELIA